MAFVPAGYYEFDGEDEDFDFGDGYVDQYEVTKVEVSQSTEEESFAEALLERGSARSLVEVELEVREEAPLSAGSAAAAGDAPSTLKGILSNSPEGSPSASRRGNRSKSSNSSSPVRFNISNSPTESDDSAELVRDVPKPVSTSLVSRGANDRGGRGMSCDRDDDDDEGSRGQLMDERSKGRLSQLEMMENMKVALKRGNCEQVVRLLDEGFDPNLPLASGWPPLLHACDSCQEAVVKLLLDRGADPNATKDLLTALMVLCMRKPQHLLDKGQGCARLLISKGAKVNARDRHHMTPLLYACQTGQVGLAELLVQSSADVNAKDVKGWTPLFYAASKGHTPLLRLLVKKGADPKAACNQHELPATVAYASGHMAAADWLEGVATKKDEGSGGLEVLPPHPLLGGGEEGDCSDGKPTHDHAHSTSKATPTSTSDSLSTATGDLDMFLLGLQLGHLIPLFKQHKVEFGQLLSMTDSDLQLVGVAQVGSRKKILNGVLEVHKREWSMPDSQLPFGRPISCPELSVILSNLNCHTCYLQGSAHFLLTHIKSDGDLLGPHVEPEEAKKLSKDLSEVVRAVGKLKGELEELQSVAQNNLPTCSQSPAPGRMSSWLPRWTRENSGKTLALLLLGTGVATGVALTARHWTT